MGTLDFEVEVPVTGNMPEATHTIVSRARSALSWLLATIDGLATATSCPRATIGATAATRAPAPTGSRAHNAPWPDIWCRRGRTG